MKKNVVTVIVGVLVLIALCVGAYFVNEKNEADKMEYKRTMEKIEKVGILETE